MAFEVGLKESCLAFGPDDPGRRVQHERQPMQLPDQDQVPGDADEAVDSKRRFERIGDRCVDAGRVDP